MPQRLAKGRNGLQNRSENKTWFEWRQTHPPRTLPYLMRNVNTRFGDASVDMPTLSQEVLKILQAVRLHFFIRLFRLDKRKDVIGEDIRIGVRAKSLDRVEYGSIYERLTCLQVSSRPTS